jgi:hypothetical protein
VERVDEGRVLGAQLLLRLAHRLVQPQRLHNT